MASNVVRKRNYSFQNRTSSDRGHIGRAVALFAGCMLLVAQATTQYIAHAFGYHTVLGGHLSLGGYPVYPFYRGLYWLYELMSVYRESRSGIALASAFVFAVGMLGSAFATRAYYFGTRKKSLESLHGSAQWATPRQVGEAGLLAQGGYEQPEGAVVGGVKVGRGVRMLRHNGREHILCYAPTRSGKGVSLVLPTLLDGWRESAFVLDIKSENYNLSAGYRRAELGQKILKLDFTDPLAVQNGTSATFNPLEEVALDYDFKDGLRPDAPDTIYELVPSGTSGETATIQQIVSIIIDPDGRGLSDHWEKTACSFMLGCITHLLYRAKIMGQGCPGIADVLSELTRPGEAWQDTVRRWQSFPHLGCRGIKAPEGYMKTLPIVHPIVAQEAQSLLNKPEKEAGSVLSTVISNLGLFRDPVIARNTGRSTFRIRDLMNGDAPVSCYLVIHPNDQLRLMPLTRLVLTQIVFTLAARMDFQDGRSVDAHRHRLLLLLDEFPSLGKMELFERALGFIGGYGLKAYIIVQGLPQLYKAYGKEESIRVGCHIQVAFAPNDMETADYLSRATGQATIIKENYSESTQPGKLFGGKSRQVSLQEVQRPLMTPDECRRLPGLRKDARGDVTDAGDMLIFPAGYPAIYGKQVLYFQDAEMNRRSKIPPPEESDILL